MLTRAGIHHRIVRIACWTGACLVAGAFVAALAAPNPIPGPKKEEGYQTPVP